MVKVKRKLVYGVGVNNADYPVYRKGEGGKTQKCPFYSTWSRMLERCYSKRWHKVQPTYSGCSVSVEWHKFLAFKSWMEAQDWEGKQLDKDILMVNNKVYSPDTCCFVSRSLNLFLMDTGSARGKWPIGVSYSLPNKKFKAMCCNPFDCKHEFLGYFNCPEQAHESWRQRKHSLAERYADMQTDQRVATALRKRFSIERWYQGGFSGQEVS